MSLCDACRKARDARNEKTVRQLLYYMVEDMGIDATSDIGMYIIENYRPCFETRAEMAKVLHDEEGIRDWLAEHTGRTT